MNAINTKVYSIDIKNSTISAKFLGTLNGRNIVPPNVNGGAKIIDKNDKLIRYELLDEFSEKEISFLESQLIEAVDMVEKAIVELKNKTVLGLESMLDVFLNYDDISRNKVIQKYSEILDVLKSKMRFGRKYIYEEKCESFDYVYISTNCETLITTIYDKFFEQDEFFDRIFTRSSWLIHEASHISGLGAEAGSEVFDNAENYRKFACLVCDVATFEELYPEGNHGKTLPLKSNIVRKEFPGPDQPRSKDGKWEPKNPDSKDNDKDKKDDTDKSKDGKEPKASFKPNRTDTPFKENNPNNINIKEASYQDGSDGVWASSDIQISNLEPNSDYSIVIDAQYNYSDTFGEQINDKISVAYDVKSDANGNIIIDRVGWINANSSKDSIDVNDGLSVDFSITAHKGSVSNNFNTEKVNWNSSSNFGEDRNSQKVTDYLASHASKGTFDSKYRAYENSDYKGGVITGNKTNSSGIKIINGTIKTK